MIERVCLLLEALSMVICLHHLYGEKFKFSIINTSYLAIHMIFFTVINYYKLPSSYSIMIYPMIIIYCGIRFGFKWKEIIINYILHMAIIGVIQLIIAIIYSWIFNFFSSYIITLKNKELLIVNSGVLLVVIFILPLFRINRLALYLQNKERVLAISIIFCVLLTIFSFTNYKVFNGLKVFQYLVVFISVSLFFILAGQLGKYKIKAKEIETELRMNQLFSDSFKGLIDDIRLRQHEFDNHISTIYSLHYTCKSYDELVNAQNKYGQMIIRENRFNKLLKAGNPLIIGFLYGKFIEIEKLGIVITYQIEIGNLDINIPVYKLVEILGNLLKNAVEAIGQYAEENRALHVVMEEINGELNIEVRNKSEFIDYGDIENFFSKGFSKKGKNRGLGLYNVKNICDEYSLNILCENKLFAEENWMSFTINNKKECCTNDRV